MKFLAAVSGAALLGFVVIHMLGNLQIFLPPEKINHYGHLLKSNALLLWGFRIGLLVMVTIHIYSVVTLTLRNREARPVGYAEKKPLGASLASRTMIISGLILLAFIVFHLLQFTILVIDPAYRNLEATISGVDRPVHDVYRMVIMGFSNPLVVVFYILSMALLCTHLSHGAESMFRSLGLSDDRHLAWQVWLARGVSVALFLGFSAVPAAVFLGVVK